MYGLHHTNVIVVIKLPMVQNGAVGFCSDSYSSSLDITVEEHRKMCNRHYGLGGSAIWEVDVSGLGALWFRQSVI